MSIDRTPVGTAAVTKQRDLLLDHWKLLLIVLVVLGHTIPGNPVIFAAIYSFHMPAFILLLGITSRVRPSWRSQAEVVVLLVIFQALYGGYVSALGWEVQRWWARPVFVLWFYVSMLCWRVLLRPLLWTRWPMTVAIALALGVGMTSRLGQDYSVSRTLVFLPFYVAGHLHGARLMAWARRERGWSSRVLYGITGLVVAFGCALLVQDHTILLEGKESYRLMGFGRWHGLLLRTGVLLVATVVSLCFLVAASRPARWSVLGRHTRSVFLLHGFFSIAAVELLLEQPDFGARWFILIAIGVVALVVLLAQPVVARSLDRLVP